jgi:hypothetical protein
MPGGAEGVAGPRRCLDACRWVLRCSDSRRGSRACLRCSSPVPFFLQHLLLHALSLGLRCMVPCLSACPAADELFRVNEELRFSRAPLFDVSSALHIMQTGGQGSAWHGLPLAAPPLRSNPSVVHLIDESNASCCRQLSAAAERHRRRAAAAGAAPGAAGGGERGQQGGAAAGCAAPHRLPPAFQAALGASAAGTRERPAPMSRLQPARRLAKVAIIRRCRTASPTHCLRPHPHCRPSCPRACGCSRCATGGPGWWQPAGSTPRS